ncbi:hypothetical protein HJC23_013571 [Cyclotella cryptica]|uniref:Uncharacterized protein n=1 Tax=Cyclotella cryptica TaxID=29204 RepID=A0ABD3PCH8_9STRA
MATSTSTIRWWPSFATRPTIHPDTPSAHRSPHNDQTATHGLNHGASFARSPTPHHTTPTDTGQTQPRPHLPANLTAHFEPTKTLRKETPAHTAPEGSGIMQTPEGGKHPVTHNRVRLGLDPPVMPSIWPGLQAPKLGTGDQMSSNKDYWKKRNEELAAVVTGPRARKPSKKCQSDTTHPQNPNEKPKAKPKHKEAKRKTMNYIPNRLLRNRPRHPGCQ